MILNYSVLNALNLPYFFNRPNTGPMKTSITYLALAALLTSTVGQAQQSPSTPQPTPTSTAPCSKGAPAQQRQPGWLEKKAKAFACQQNKNLCDLPSSPSEITGGTPGDKPCPATTTASPASPPKAQLPTSNTTTPAPASSGTTPAYVCPPKSELIPGTPYCLTGDHTTVDAIPLPPGMSTPAPPAKTPAQTKPQQ